HHVRCSKGHLCVSPHQLLVGVSVPAPRALYQGVFDLVEWSAHHCCELAMDYTAVAAAVPRQRTTVPFRWPITVFATVTAWIGSQRVPSTARGDWRGLSRRHSTCS